MKRSLLLLLVLAGTAALADDLDDFRSDGCSAFPDGTLKQKERWRSCCVVHDLSYWMGGSSDERIAADLALRECVYQVGEPAIAELMLAGVRVGGTPWLPTRFRWAYGWPWGRGYDELSDKEKMQFADKIKAAKAVVAKEESASKRGDDSAVEPTDDQAYDAQDIEK
jgi:hypothetical protein